MEEPNYMKELDDPTEAKDLLKEVHFGESLNPEELKQLQDIVSKHSKAFSLDGRLGRPDIKVKIHVKEDVEPVGQRMYHATERTRKAIDKQMDEWISQEIISPADSPWRSPIVVVFRTIKGVEKARICIDYRKLNQYSIKDQYPIPRQSDIFTSLSGMKYFTKLDANSGFHQLPLEEESKNLTAFASHRGLFKFNTMPLGIINGPPIFQRFMNNLFASVLWIFILVYIDDLIIYSKTFQDHLEHVAYVLDKVTEANLTLSPKKCYFGYESIEVLGRQVSRLGLSILPEKLQAIYKMLPPKNVKELRSVIGLWTFYSQFIKHFALIIKPLYNLLKKDVKWTWGPKEQEAFNVAKQALLSSPILIHPDSRKPFRMYTDASLNGVSAILCQHYQLPIKKLKDTRLYDKLKRAWDAKKPVPHTYWRAPEGIEDPVEDQWSESFENTPVTLEGMVAAVSRTYRKNEEHYAATEMECLALIYGLMKFRPLIEGCPKIVAITDHIALMTLRGEQFNKRLQRWALILSGYDPQVTITYKKGIQNGNADALSRSNIAEFDPNEIWDPKDGSGDKYWENTIGQNTSAAATEITKITWNPNFLNNLHEAYAKDSFIQGILQDIKADKDPNKPKKRLYFVNDDGTLIMKDDISDKIVIPRSMVKDILKLVHDELCNGAHFGVFKTLHNVTLRFYWKTLQKDVKDYVQSCPKCQAANYRTHSPYGEIIPNSIPHQPYERVTMDFIGPLPPSSGHSAIFVILCALTKHLTLIPTTTRLSEEQTAHLFYKHIILKHGLPIQVLSDRDPRWRENFWKQVLKALGADRLLSTSHHPQTDGLTEATNKTIVTSLRKFVNENLDNWSEILPALESAYNSTIHRSTGYTPFYLLHGHEMNLPKNFDTKAPENRNFFEKDSARNFIEELQAHRTIARQNILLNQQSYAEQYNKNHSMINLKVGDLVWISAKDLELTGDYKAPGSKLRYRYEGPYPIQEVLSPITYKLALPADLGIHNVMHIDKLEPYRPSPSWTGPREQPAPPRRQHKRLTDEEVVCITAEKLVTQSYRKRDGSTGKKRVKYYQALWKDSDGHNYEDFSWTPAKNFNNCPEVLQNWKTKQSLLQERQDLPVKDKDQVPPSTGHPTPRKEVEPPDDAPVKDPVTVLPEHSSASDGEEEMD